MTILATTLGWLCYAGAISILVLNWGRVSYKPPSIQ